MRVSVCTSVLNQRDLLKGMIHSVRAQTLTDWELVIVDDGSTEDIKGLIAEFNDPRIRLHIFPSNRGVPHGINWALSHATGDYVQPLSADERIEPDKLLWQVGYLDEHKDIDGIWGLPQNGPLGERPECEQYHLKAQNRSQEAWVRTLLNLENVPIGGASMLWRREVLDDVGLFDPEFFTTSDLEWFIRFFKNHKGVVMPYRWAWSVERTDKPLSQTVTAEQFGKDLAKVRAKHPLKAPKVMSQVTFAIPCKNMAHFISDTLDSIRRQTWAHCEVMVLDDASTDNLSEILSKYPEVKYFRVEESLGANGAQNQMLARCETPFFVVLAADDTIDPMFAEKCISQFSKDPWLEFVATQTDFIDKDGNPHTTPHPFKTIIKARQKPQGQWIYELRYGNQYFGAGMYRTQAIKDLGGWDTTVGCLGDYDMYLKLLQRENIFVIEEDLTHTRIHDNNQSILDRTRAKQLPIDYHTIKSRYYQPREKIIIATPFYEMRGFSPYITSLVGTAKLLSAMNIDFDFWELSGDSYVDRAKNTIMNKFLEDPSNTQLFIIDSDMQWNSDAILKFIQLPEEIVAGSYPQKNAWGKWTSIPVVEVDKDKPEVSHPVGRTLTDGTALLLSAYLAGGFLRIRRSALQKFKDHYKELLYKDPAADPSDPDRLYTEFGTCELKDGLRWGEDRVFGNRMAALGIQCWIYPDVNFGHYGVKGWTGNFDKFLRGNADGTNVEQDPNVTDVTRQATASQVSHA